MEASKTEQVGQGDNGKVKFYAHIDYEDNYVQPLLLSALSSRLPASSYKIISSAPTLLDKPLLQILQYENLHFELAMQNQTTILLNSYVIRKALIRKHYLNDTVVKWTKKTPKSTLNDHVKLTVELEVDYADYLDEALQEAYELRDSLAKNEEKEASEREWWILKPSMADRGNGIRLFSSEEQLTGIFEEWEADEDEDDDEAENVYASQLRHFVAQVYIHPPLLLEKRKFHIRTYVLAVGAIKVFVYRPMLALFAEKEYQAPWQDSDLDGHLTNTCLQGSDIRQGSIRQFWNLDDNVAGLQTDWKKKVFEQVCTTTSELFEAAARNQIVNFQLLPCCFELFGLDYLVDEEGTAWLLEVNAFPDFKQTGEELKELVHGLWEDVVDVAVKPFFGIADDGPGSGRMISVLDIDMGRKAEPQYAQRGQDSTMSEENNSFMTDVLGQQ